MVVIVVNEELALVVSAYGAGPPLGGEHVIPLRSCNAVLAPQIQINGVSLIFPHIFVVMAGAVPFGVVGFFASAYGAAVITILAYRLVRLARLNSVPVRGAVSTEVRLPLASFDLAEGFAVVVFAPLHRVMAFA